MAQAKGKDKTELKDLRWGTLLDLESCVGHQTGEKGSNRVKSHGFPQQTPGVGHPGHLLSVFFRT